MRPDGVHDRDPQRLARLTPLIERTAELADRCGFFFDFDGTLVPIVDHPDDAVPAPGSLQRLAELASMVARVAIVSGRPVGVLAPHFHDLPVLLFGLYGLERVDAAGRVVTDAAAERWIPVIEGVTSRARAELPERVLVEPKRISVALHYRMAPQLRPVVEQWGRAAAAEHGLMAQPGRMVLELRPPVHGDKGDVLREQSADLRAAWYFGDDLGDLAAFDALDARRRADPEFLAVRVAVANEETGDSVRAAADLVVDSADALPSFLGQVVDGLSRDQTRRSSM